MCISELPSFPFLEDESASEHGASDSEDEQTSLSWGHGADDAVRMQRQFGSTVTVTSWN